MKTKYAAGARPPSAGMAMGDTSRYPTGGDMPSTPALPTSVAESFPYMLQNPDAKMPSPKDTMDSPALNASTGYSDSGASSQMV